MVICTAPGCQTTAGCKCSTASATNGTPPFHAVTERMIDAFIRASDSQGLGAEKGSYLWEMTERGLKAALAMSPHR